MHRLPRSTHVVRLTPAPIGYVEDGWADVVSELLRDIGHALASHSGVTIDVAEWDGLLRFDYAFDDPGRGGVPDGELSACIAAAVDEAQARSAPTCARCGRPGRLCRDRPGWPKTRCDAHAVVPSPRRGA